jgi:hypothetical protein
MKNTIFLTSFINNTLLFIIALIRGWDMYTALLVGLAQAIVSVIAISAITLIKNKPKKFPSMGFILVMFVNIVFLAFILLLSSSSPKELEQLASILTIFSAIALPILTTLLLYRSQKINALHNIILSAGIVSVHTYLFFEFALNVSANIVVVALFIYYFSKIFAESGVVKIKGFQQLLQEDFRIVKRKTKERNNL